MITLDGSRGEGGGQVLRTALALSMATGTPIRIEQIRARRSRPGLLRQHLTAVEAATRLCGARTQGASLGASQLEFVPGPVRPGEYTFAVGTAGSATLVLQTVLPVLLTASGPSTLVLEGGTHNPWAPPYDFLARSFLPLVERLGPRIEARLERHGFYPAGGGRFTVRVDPVARLGRLDLAERGAVRGIRARALVANLSQSIGARELAVVAEALPGCARGIETVASPGPGNVLLIEIASEPVTEVFTGFGEKGQPAEDVARLAVEAAQAYLAADVPVGEHLADQLMVPLALAGGGSFVTTALSSHGRTNLEVIEQVLGVGATVEQVRDPAWKVSFGQTG